jgi:cold shock CspA family protein
MKGVIERVLYERGFGFIKGEDGLDYFLHARGVCYPEVLRNLKEGEHVDFVPVAEPEKGLRATQVRRNGQG